MTCAHCHEPILPDDEYTPVIGADLHRECLVRMTNGSAAHQQRRKQGLRCGAEIGQVELCDDDPLLSKRDQARAAFHFFIEHHVRSGPYL